MMNAFNRVILLLLTICWASPAATQPQTTQQDLLEYGIWLDFNGGFRDLEIRTVTVDPERPTRLYAGGRGFLYRSLDGGASWDVVLSLRNPGSRSIGSRSGRSYDITTIEDLTDEQIERVDDLYEELEEEQYQQLLQEYDEYTATLIVNSMQDELLEQALEEVLADQEEQLAAPDAGLGRAEARSDNLFTQIVVDPAQPNRIFAASGRGLYRSEDYGTTWEQVNQGATRLEEGITSVALADQAVVVGTARGAYRSEDNARTWARVPGPPSTAAIAFVAASPTHPQYLYLVADGRFYRSRDGGGSWLPETVPPGVPADGFGNLAVDPDNSNHLLAATVIGVQESVSSGASFRLTGTVGMRDRRVLWVAWYHSAMLAGTRDGIYASADGGDSWQDLNQGLQASTVYQIAVGPDDHIWIATNAGVYQLMHPWEMISGQEMARGAAEMWSNEPDLRQTVHAALTHYEYLPLAVDGWATRLMWSRFLPDVRVEYRIYQQRRETSNYTYDETGESYQDAEDLLRQGDREFRAMAWLDVADMLFDPREMSVRQEGERLVRRRDGLVRRVVRLYNSRRELMMRIAEGRSTTLARLLLDQMELAELTARLDAMTGWYFSAYSRIAGR